MDSSSRTRPEGQPQSPSQPPNRNPATDHDDPTPSSSSRQQTGSRQISAQTPAIGDGASGLRNPSRSGSGDYGPPTNIDVHGLPTPAVDYQSSWSTSSDRQLGHGSQQDTQDRVYPVRSLLTLDPSKKASEQASQRSGSISDRTAISWRPMNPRSETEGPIRGVSGGATTSPPPTQDRFRQRRQNTLSSVQADAERYGSSGPLPIFAEGASDHGSDPAADTASQGEEISTGRQSPAEALPEDLVRPRFKHVMTDGGHAVITGRDGKLQKCEDEPIHAPGAIQGFGLMVAIREEPDGAFSVRYVSETSERLLGYTPQELFKLESFLDILTEEQAENLLDHIDFIRDEDADPAVNGPEVFSLSVRPPRRRPVKLWTAIHINNAHPELIICEFELDDDHEFPQRPPDELTPDIPEDTLHANPTLEELTESTEILSKPLRVLRSARKRRGEAEAMQVFDVMSQIQEQLAAAPNLEKFLKILVGIVKELTGFHRVMIYQFDAAFNGKVVTELVDMAKTKDLYKGLQFPHSDIPPQARALYQINRVRLLYDRDLETARIVCRSEEELIRPLDMTHAYLRSMSPIHLKYLANMNVRASMSISINAFQELWGLIACHSYGPRGMRVSFPIRKMCRLVGDTASRNIERLSYAGRLQARKLINTAPTDKNPSGYIIASSDDLLKLFDADFGMLSIRGETKILGKIEQSQEALAMLEYLRLKKFTSVVTSQDIRFDFTDLRYPPGFSVIAGLLYVPLSVGGHDFIVFFRRGQIHEVRWAGNPYEKSGKYGHLEPRSSFKAWNETVIGRCRDWSEEQVETAAVLCLVYGKFIEVWRQKEAALQSSKLTRLLLANSAHEFRTPLNQVINYIEIALEGSLDSETRENLAKSHSASKSLIYVINDLLDLTKAEEGQDLIKDEMFDLPACVREATEQFRTDAERKGIKLEVVEHPGFPKLVYGDQQRVRQAVTNVTANAMEHTEEGFVRTELYAVEVQEEQQRVWVEIVVQDSGHGMDGARLDALFRDLEQVSSDWDELMTPDPDGKRPEALGLGLAVVGRMLRNVDGQLRVKSEPGKGSRFIMQIPFDLGDNQEPTEGGDSAAVSSVASVSTSVPPAVQGEVLLVDRGSTTSVSSLAGPQADRKSFDATSITSQHSVNSKASGASSRSDADRLIDAIQSPLTLGEPDSDVIARQRRNSRGAYYNPSARVGGGGGGGDSARSTSPPNPTGRPTALPRSISSPGHGQDPDQALRHAVVYGQSPLLSQMQGKELSKQEGEPIGMAYVTDARTPIRPVKIAEEYFDEPEQKPQVDQSASRVLYELPQDVTSPITSQKPPSESGSRLSLDQESTRGSVMSGPSAPMSGGVKLQLLVAEDDKINFTVLRKRLEKAGHEVSHAVNGQQCATKYEKQPRAYDVVLMDMQMPIVDGLNSTKMIRAFEKRYSTHLSPVAEPHGRIPIFAVSASLVESEKDTYVNAGFDGWVLKPIDFSRLSTLLLGLLDENVRRQTLYVPGEWERGGWFRDQKAGSGSGGVTGGDAAEGREAATAGGTGGDAVAEETPAATTTEADEAT